ncbi:hypothetical protein KM1_236850 [Entamoeba histolytica HM-3:IMSS]|uniref:Uncharacterized protein n=6 Tax=Entamoeba histolytica TaxID=5759 RepID=C4LTQ3_ENTH1|nr:hypothetical protein EHI_050260 [Entamoeba histolytica HM-1:IMSS]EMD43769.1 Hypothetical protein EHI5A_065370 [Entamoeba histolytica KU27]EMS13971.1 hypothetical protein KM1_236850 [Entamoeba histolytica HM-3:IMSS]ENY60357.1 hypothetical protein EHI7A_142560 [Entamoeba histolytica HM-1:IMSS-A]GAT91955.1 hypothetical protein CL6EHI_050260 [Entamoeba histolytica]EAL43206.1 hypothetical protein EHI_050260 [Entamoeba histolytica HM-1:IMSS]|eukprot:XP_648596.1 hypothetical protein EHI_050260 [Entamoeba histolytica HM-1:IMSS]
MGRSLKTTKKIMSYHDLVEMIKKGAIVFEKEFKTIPTKESALKTYIKKLEKELNSMYVSLNFQIKIDSIEDQLNMIDNIIHIWSILLNIIKEVDQMIIPHIFYKFIIMLVNRSEVQPHHLLVNNPSLKESNRNEFLIRAIDLRKLTYETFFCIGDILTSKQFTLFASMKLVLKPKKPSTESKEEPKEKKKKKEEPVFSNESIKISVKEYKDGKININEDSFEIENEGKEEDKNLTQKDIIVNEIEASLKTVEGNTVSINEERRQSVLSRVLIKPMEDVENSKDESMTKKQKRFSSQLGESIFVEDEFFCENNVSPLFIQFFPHYLAFMFFQIPEFRSQLLKIVKGTNTNLMAFSKCMSEEEVMEVKRKFPRIFGFDEMERIIKSISKEDISEKFKRINLNWINLLNPNSDIFMSFYFNYIKFIYFTIKGQDDFIDYGEIYGLEEFINSYVCQRLEFPKNHSISIMSENDKRSLLIDYPTVVNYMIEHLFDITNRYDISQCDLAVSLLGKWFNILIEHKRMSNEQFEIEVFIEGINKILETDHYQLIINTLSMLYDASFFFIGKARLLLFKDLLIDKWFMKLFNHWNNTVRQIFHHFILYKFLFTRRSHLNWSKFDKNESSLIKKQLKRGVKMEDIDRIIFDSLEEKLNEVKMIIDGDTTLPYSFLKLYCQSSIVEYQNALRLYIDWDKANLKEVPKTCSPFTEFDLETLT